MNEFSAYLPSMWQVNGLLTVPKATKPTNTRAVRSQSFTQTVAVACFFAVAIATISFRISPYGMQVSTPYPTSQGKAIYSVSSPSVDVPAGYWDNLVASLRVAPVLAETSSDDLPDPLI